MDAFTIAFSILFVIALLAFLNQFRLLSLRGLIFVISAFALALGFSIFRSYRRRKLEEDLKRREKELQQQESRLDKLEAEYQGATDELIQARQSLRRERARFMRSILEIEAEKDERFRGMREGLNDLTVDEIFERYDRLVGEG